VCRICQQGYQALYTVEGEGFLQLAQALINVGVRYGQVNAADVMPHCTTVSNNVAKRAAELKESVVVPDIRVISTDGVEEEQQMCGRSVRLKLRTYL
jgi:hypothetical protein